MLAGENGYLCPTFTTAPNEGRGPLNELLTPTPKAVLMMSMAACAAVDHPFVLAVGEGHDVSLGARAQRMPVPWHGGQGYSEVVEDTHPV